MTAAPLVEVEVAFNTEPLTRPHENTLLSLPGVDNARATCPDSAALDITGDLDLRAVIAMDDWTPVADFNVAAIIGKWSTVGAYGLFVTSTGFLQLIWHETGGAQRTATSTIATGFVNGTARWIRATLDVDNGASGRDIKFYVSSDPVDTVSGSVLWSQLGATVTQANTTSIRATVDLGFVGAIGALEEWSGKFWFGEIRNGIAGTVVADPDFRTLTPGTTSFSDGTNTWTVVPTAEVIFDPDGGWTRISDGNGVRRLRTRRGVQVKLNKSEPGEATMVLDNRNRALDPSNTASPYWPNVRPRRRIRVAVTPAGETLRRLIFTGFVERWTIDWNAPATDGTVTVEASDLLALVADKQLPPSILHQTILDQAPTSYWPLTETSGLVADDVAGNQDGEYTQFPQSGQSALPFVPRPFNTFSSQSEAAHVQAQVSVATSPITTDVTFTLWFASTLVLGASERVVFMIASDGQVPSTQIQIGVQRQVSDVHEVTFITLLDGVSTDIGAGTIINPHDGRPHFIAARVKQSDGVVSVTFDGDLEINRVFNPSAVTVLAEIREFHFGSQPELGVFPGALLAQVGHVSVFPTLVSFTDLDNQEKAVSLAPAAWAGDTTKARLVRILDLVGIAAGDRVLGADAAIKGVCSGTTLDRQNFLRYADKIAATERGLLFVTPEGRVAFPGRFTPGASIITFTDDGTVGQVPYLAIRPAFSLDRIVNSATVSRESGVDQEAEATASLAELGPRHVSVATLHSTVTAARLHAAALIQQNAEPRTVITELLLAGRHDDVPVEASLDLELGDVVTVVGTPTGGGDPLSQQSIIERIEHAFDGSNLSWNVNYAFAEVPEVFGMAFDLLAEQILDADTATVTFSSIAQTYRDLRLLAVARGTTAADIANLRMRFNNVATASYDSQRDYGETSTAAASRTAAGTSAVAGVLPAANAAAGRVGTADILIPHYAATVFHKAWTSVWSAVTDVAADSWTGNDGGLITATTAVSRLDFFPEAGNFLAGSRFALYGIR